MVLTGASSGLQTFGDCSMSPSETRAQGGAMATTRARLTGVSFAAWQDSRS